MYGCYSLKVRCEELIEESVYRIIVNRPTSTGRIRIKDMDPFVEPVIDPQYVILFGFEILQSDQ